MKIKIMWLKEYEDVQIADIDTLRKKLDKPEWINFPVDPIMECSRDYAISLFSRKATIIIREGDTIISNDKRVRQTYHERGGLKVLALDAIIHSDKPLSEVGFTCVTNIVSQSREDL